MSTQILSFHDVTMTFRGTDQPERTVLNGASCRIEAGQTVSLVGRSGTGKSTLLHLAAGILAPTAGRIVLDGHEMSSGSEIRRTHWRRDCIGLVFQFFHLLPHLNVIENVALPGWVAGMPGREAEARARHLLQAVGLQDRLEDPVGRLSGGEMQRVALCRALLRRPKLVLADEPTGSLDERSGHEVMELLLEMTRAEGGALLYVTHSREIAHLADRHWRLSEGRIRTEPTS